jgi:hypothetical protein
LPVAPEGAKGAPVGIAHSGGILVDLFDQGQQRSLAIRKMRTGLPESMHEVADLFRCYAQLKRQTFTRTWIW